MDNIATMFQLPLSIEAYSQFQKIQLELQQMQLIQQPDKWNYIWGSDQYSATKAYKDMVGHKQVQPSIHWMWATNCQMKHKVFFCLVLKERVNTRGTLKRRNMQLDDYNCEMCILQKEETIHHLFLRCSFARACWLSIGLFAPTTTTNAEIAIKRFKRQLNIPFYMDVIILMTWSVWTTRNRWIFDGIDPAVENCIEKFKKEFALVLSEGARDMSTI